MTRGRNYMSIIIPQNLIQQFPLMRKPSSWKSGTCYDFVLLESGPDSCYILHFELLTSEIDNMKFRDNIYILS